MKPAKHVNSRPAQHWVPFRDDRAECRLCPRHCRPKNNRMGFCGVRGSLNGEFHTFNFGQSLAATEEIIETEAVNHFMPGARILSMGNVGCMMACSFCQNWETSQVKHLDYSQVRQYQPQELVDLCLDNQIPIISWTYNDPVVWHEFVIETSQLAQQNGIKTLYKSAFYIEEDPVKELLECIDIFSLSLKSLNAEFYQKQTKARLAPVLERIKQVSLSTRHLELSQLVIPELNDSDKDILDTINWIKNEIGTQTPLHFVAFHPAYQYTHVNRTSLNTLKHARQLALDNGMQHVYLGNTYEHGLNDTHCLACGAVLVLRYGLHATIQNLDESACCTQCGAQSSIIHPHQNTTNQHLDMSVRNKHMMIHWTDEVHSAHIIQTQTDGQDDTIRIHTLYADNEPVYLRDKRLSSGLDRFIISRQSPEETGVMLSWDSTCHYQNLAVLDRAHYPTQMTEQPLIPQC